MAAVAVVVAVAVAVAVAVGHFAAAGPVGLEHERLVPELELGLAVVGSAAVVDAAADQCADSVDVDVDVVVDDDASDGPVVHAT